MLLKMSFYFNTCHSNDEMRGVLISKTQWNPSYVICKKGNMAGEPLWKLCRVKRAPVISKASEGRSGFKGC